MIRKSAYYFIIILLIAGVFALGGCSGGTSAGDTSSSGGAGGALHQTVQGTADEGGKFVINIKWPEYKGAPHQAVPRTGRCEAVQGTAKLIPQETLIIKMVITGTGLTTSRVVEIDRTQSSVTVARLPAGQKSADICALDGSNNVIANRVIDFVITSGQSTTSTIELGASITSKGYVPQNITIRKGDTLMWKNSDTAVHSVTSDDGGFVSSGDMAAGATYSVAFNTVGTYKYHDSQNIATYGSVIVKANPAITSLSSSSASYGTSITINGTNFKASQYLASGTVTLNGSSVTPTSWSDTGITFTVPTNASSGNVIVTIDGVASNAIAFTIATPAITYVGPDVITSGVTVTVYGTNFGSAQGTSTVKFNGTSAAITSWADTSIVCTSPDFTTGNVVVRVAGNNSNGVACTRVTGWTTQALSDASTGTFVNIKMTSATDGWCVLRDTSINNVKAYLTTDGGTTWTRKYNEGFAGLVGKLFALSADRAWLCGWWAGPNSIAYTTNGGTDWGGTIPNDGANHSATAFYFADNSNGYAVTNDGRMFQSSNGGAAGWTRVYLEGASTCFNSMSFQSMNLGWVCGNSGTIYKVTDTGLTWTAQVSGTTYNINDIEFVDSNNGWAVGLNGVLLHTTNGGTTWTAQNTGIFADYYGVSALDSSHVWACGLGGKIYYTSDGGTHWNLVESGTTLNLYGIDFTDSTHGWVVGDQGLVRYYR